MIQCWRLDPGQRPEFPQIVSYLQHILSEHIVMEDDLRNSRVPSGNYTDLFSCQKMDSNEYTHFAVVPPEPRLTATNQFNEYSENVVTENYDTPADAWMNVDVAPQRNTYINKSNMLDNNF